MAPGTGISPEKHSGEEEGPWEACGFPAGCWDMCGAAPWSGPVDTCIGITGNLVKSLLLVQLFRVGQRSHIPNRFPTEADAVGPWMAHEGPRLELWQRLV